MSLICPSCGRVCDQEDRFCMDCGAPLAPRTREATPRPDQGAEFAFSQRPAPGDWPSLIRSWARPMNKGFYLGSFVGAALVIMLSMYYWYQSMVAENWGMVLAATAPMVMAALALWGVFGLMTYRMWAALQDGQTRTKPGMAAGFLFIPGFSLYWIFPAVWGFSKEYNALIERHNLGLAPLPQPMFLSLAICYAGSSLPYLGTFFVLPLLIFMMFVANKSIDAVNGLLEQLGVTAAPQDAD